MSPSVRLWSIAALSSLIGLGCSLLNSGSRVLLSVKAYSDPEAELAPPLVFAFENLGQTTGGVLAEKELQGLVRERLSRIGFVERSNSEQTADLIVAVSGFIGPHDRYVPPSSIWIPVPSTSEATTRSTATSSYSGYRGYGSAHANSVSTTTTRSTDYVPVTTGGYTERSQVRIVHLSMALTANGGASFELAWEGSVDSEGPSDDLMLVAPYMLDELFSEFPRRSGRPTSRSVAIPPSARKATR
jgi:hypothetical protein